MEMQPSKLKFKKKDNKREQKINSIYSRCLIARQVTLPMVSVGKNLKETIEKNIKTEEMTGSQTCPLKKRLVIYLRKKAESKFTLKKLSKNAPLSPTNVSN